MKKTTLKLALISACFAFTVTAACNSNKNAEGMADSDSAMIETDTMITDTAGTGTSGTKGSDTIGTDTIGTRKGTGGTGTTPKP